MPQRYSATPGFEMSGPARRYGTLDSGRITGRARRRRRADLTMSRHAWRLSTQLRRSTTMMRIPRSLAAAGVTIALLPSEAWAQASPDVERYGWGPHMMGWGGGWFGMIFGPIFMILVLALLIAVPFSSCAGSAGHGRPPRHISHYRRAHTARHPQGALRSRRNRQGGIRGAAPHPRRVSPFAQTRRQRT